jgi:hypothetical protein
MQNDELASGQNIRSPVLLHGVSAEILANHEYSWFTLDGAAGRGRAFSGRIACNCLA